MLRWSIRILACLSFLAMGSLACSPLLPPPNHPDPRLRLRDYLPVPPSPPEPSPEEQNQVIARSTRVATPAQVNALVAASNAFALDLYVQLRTGEGNLFFSPYSISTALAMTSAGARGQTLAEMSRVLHLPGQAELHPAVSTMTADMLRRAGKDVELATANALWLQKDRVLRADFLSLTRTYYRAGVQQVDFIHNTELARRTINDWTEKQTHQRIRDLLPPGVLKSDSRLVLTNAIYFKAKWDREFAKAATRDEDFHLLGGATAKKSMMHQTDRFSYTEAAGLQALEMPYAGNEFSLVILLPRREANLAALEANLAKNFKEWLDGLSPQEVIVTVPKFEMTIAMSMKDMLTRMGMSRAFSPDADFKGIDDGRNQLYIGDVIHKAFVEVSEKGTEAAAATAVVGLCGCAPGFVPASPPEFTADRPFVYFIRDKRTGCILFLGRYVGK